MLHYANIYGLHMALGLPLVMSTTVFSLLMMGYGYVSTNICFLYVFLYLRVYPGVISVFGKSLNFS
jgi:hypothetical protein